MRNRRLPLTAGIAATLTVLSLGLAACGGDDDGGKADGGGDPTNAATRQAAPDTSPLTGLDDPDGGVEDHPVLVAKIDNTSSSSPQVGLGSADLVVEELVEGNLTRLAAFFYTETPKEVGPIRSMRASDIGIVSPVDGTMVTSGAAGVTIQRLNDAGVKFVQEGANGFHRDPNRSSLYSVIADLGAIADDTSDGKDARPDDYLPWGSAEDLPEGKDARTLTADFGGHSTNWTFENGTYVNQNSYAADGDQFPADTVLVLRAEIGDAGYKDPAGNPVPETKFEGEGNALLFHDGKVIEGTWKKKALDGALTLSTADGDLKVPAGHVWIELVPDNASGGSVTYGK